MFHGDKVKVSRSVNADEAVTYGAAVRAAMLSEQFG